MTRRALSWLLRQVIRFFLFLLLTTERKYSMPNDSIRTMTGETGGVNQTASLGQQLLAQARMAVNKESADKAVKALAEALRDLERAKAIVRGCELKIADLEARIDDGTFV